jgi:serine carboxypeptidase-like clade 2
LLSNIFFYISRISKNVFYITGESYAGTYIPHLVKKIVKYTKENKNAVIINLKEFLIGNQ